MVMELSHVSSPREGTVIIPMLQMSKWMHREAECLTQRHKALNGSGELGTYLCVNSVHTAILVNPHPERRTLPSFVFGR